MGLVAGLVPPPSDAEIARGRPGRPGRSRRKVGITSVQDMDGSGRHAPPAVPLYQQLARTGKLTTRIDLLWPLADVEQLARLGVQAGFGDDWVRSAALKGFVDGSLGSSTAKMFAPYRNEPDSTGIFVTPPGKLREHILAADKAGLSVAVHAIGDRANAELLDIFAEVIQKNGPRDRRFRIEHAQHLRPRITGGSPTGRDRVDAAVPRHRRRPLGRGTHRRQALRLVLRLPFAAGRRGPVGVRLRLVGRPAQPAAGHRRRRQPPHARRLNSEAVEQTLTAALGVSEWVQVRGPDSMQLR